MEKEFDALKTIKIKCHPNSNPSPIVDEALEIVEQAITELKTIKEAKPSEAMECLERVNVCLETKFDEDIWNKQYNSLKNALLKAQEQDKVLEIVKNKWVNVAVLIHSETVEEYNNSAYTPYNLTEEFDLLKRWSK